ncbi:hypothetical protein AB0N05_25410 [Nocardia sp. NPDC051030]|uniref:hypothetical protein n=1 Tax=Nocardia sp. NPDC051030 TaxID=3155162 RepID=UPI0034348FBC
MAIDGSWEIEMQSPAGKQKLFFSLKSNDSELVGALKGTDEPEPDILDGKVVGKNATWDLKVTKPMPIQLTFTVTVTGDTLTGKVQPGSFPAMPISGRRLG